MFKCSTVSEATHASAASMIGSEETPLLLRTKSENNGTVVEPARFVSGRGGSANGAGTIHVLVKDNGSIGTVNGAVTVDASAKGAVTLDVDWAFLPFLPRPCVCLLPPAGATVLTLGAMFCLENRFV